MRLLIPSVYIIVALNILVNFMLLLGTNRLTGFPAQLFRCFVCSFLGGIYAGICTIAQFGFLTDLSSKIFCMILLGVLAFGIDGSGARRCVIFVILSLATEGAVFGFGQKNPALIALCSIGICAGCFFAEGDYSGVKRVYPVVIRSGGKTICLNALFDTGNCLKDPMTGEPVMVVGYKVAKNITGLSKEQLEDPLATLQSVPRSGYRLIPYVSVGKEKGMLLGIKLHNVEINGKIRRQVIALAPGELGGFDALLGGTANG